MNILLIVVAVIFLHNCIKGIIKGLFKSVFSLVAVILAIYITVQLTPYTADFLIKNTQIDNHIQENVEKNIGFEKEEAQDKKAVQKENIDETKLPDIFKQFILENNYDKAYEELGVATFYDYIITYITNVIIKGIAYIITFIAVWIVLRLLFLLLNGVTKIPILNGLNKTGGFLFGLAESILVVWLLFTLITVFSHTTTGGELYQMIGESKFLTFIYDHNLLYEYLKNFLGTFFSV